MTAHVTINDAHAQYFCEVGIARWCKDMGVSEDTWYLPTNDSRFEASEDTLGMLQLCNENPEYLDDTVIGFSDGYGVALGGQYDLYTGQSGSEYYGHSPWALRGGYGGGTSGDGWGDSYGHAKTMLVETAFWEG